jgi:hypothetical protein
LLAAHEINTPVGIGITPLAICLKMWKMAALYEKRYDQPERLYGFLESAYDTAKLIQKIWNELLHLSELKQVSADQASEQQRVFGLKEYLNDVILSQAKFREKHNIQN